MQMLDNEVPGKASTTASGMAVPLREFNLLRWFSVISLLIIASVAGGLGYVSTRFVVRDSVERDAMLTAQFIQAMAQAEVRHSQLPPGTTMGELLDPRLDQQHLQFTPDLAESTGSSSSTMSSTCRTPCWPMSMHATVPSSGRPTGS